MNDLVVIKEGNYSPTKTLLGWDIKFSGLVEQSLLDYYLEWQTTHDNRDVVFSKNEIFLEGCYPIQIFQEVDKLEIEMMVSKTNLLEVKIDQYLTSSEILCFTINGKHRYNLLKSDTDIDVLCEDDIKTMNNLSLDDKREVWDNLVAKGWIVKKV